jgi:hypothetical protein
MYFGLGVLDFSCTLKFKRTRGRSATAPRNRLELGLGFNSAEAERARLSEKSGNDDYYVNFIIQSAL